MKKIAIFFLIVIVIISTITYIYLNYVANYRNAQKENRQFEMYQNQEILGSELTTLINKAIDYNIRNEVEQDNKGNYIDNGKNSLNIEIKFTDDDVTFNISTIYKRGSELFLAHYRDISFKCIEVQYHKETNKISYMLFEQITE